MGLCCSCHSQGPGQIGEPVIRFIVNRVVIGLLTHPRLEASSLNHKSVDHSVKNRPVIEAFLGILQKIFRRFRRFF